MLNEENCLLLIIDIQEKLLKSTFNKELLKENSIKLTKALNILELPIFITEQYPKGLGSTIPEIKNNFESIRYYEKTDFNALANQDLLRDLKSTKKTHVIVIGIETHICVHQTVEVLLKEGYEVTVIDNCCGSRDKYNHDSGLMNMKENGAKTKSLEMALFELLKSSKHPRFKDIQSLIK